MRSVTARKAHFDSVDLLLHRQARVESQCFSAELQQTFHLVDEEEHLGNGLSEVFTRAHFK